MDLLPEELKWSEFRDVPTGLSEENHGALRDAVDPPSTQPTTYVAEICLLVVEEQRWLTGRGYDSSVIRAESQLDVTRKRRHVVDIQNE
jgi:hypothetical protein